MKIIYSPLHGVGASAVCPVLAAGRDSTNVELFEPHAEPSGDFPNVPGHVSNPENPRVFDAIIERGQADRGRSGIWPPIPTAIAWDAPLPQTLAPGRRWATLTGNQLAALLTDYVLERRREIGHPVRPTLPGQDAGHHRTDPPDRRQLRRPHLRQSAGRLQVDRRVPSTRRVPTSSCWAAKNRTDIWSASMPATRTGPWPAC